MHIPRATSQRTKGNVLFPCVQEPHPPLFMGGSSTVAKRVAIDHIDTLLTWAEPPEQVASKIRSVREMVTERCESLDLVFDCTLSCGKPTTKRGPRPMI